MAERDIAHMRYKETNSAEDLREYRNIQSRVNSQIAKEKYQRKVASYQGESMKNNDKLKKRLDKQNSLPHNR